MTYTEIKSLLEYNKWATERILEVASALQPEKYAQHLGSSHGGIHGTFVHAIAANRLWLDRLAGRPQAVMLSEKDLPTLAAVRDEWSKWKVDMDQYLQTLSDNKLTESFSHQDSKGNTYSYPLSQVLQHLVNHAAFHRGQVVSMLRQQGAKPVNTDLIYYYRTLHRS